MKVRLLLILCLVMGGLVKTFAQHNKLYFGLGSLVKGDFHLERAWVQENNNFWGLSLGVHNNAYTYNVVLERGLFLAFHSKKNACLGLYLTPHLGSHTQVAFLHWGGTFVAQAISTGMSIDATIEKGLLGIRLQLGQAFGYPFIRTSRFSDFVLPEIMYYGTQPILSFSVSMKLRK